MRRPLLAGAVALAGLLTALTAPAATAEDAGLARERTVLDGGHLDLAARMTDGRLDYAIKDGTAGGEPVWREPNDVILHFDPRHAWVIPEVEPGMLPEQLGQAGETIWVDHGVEYAEGLLWPGWNTQEVLPTDIDGPVTATFTEVEGPGGFFLGQWRDHAQLGTVIGIDIDGTQEEPGSVTLPVNTHAHPLWFFTAEGVYRIRVEMSATLPSGETVSDAGTLTAVVGDTDPSGVDLPAPEEPDDPGNPGDPGDPEPPGGGGDPGGSEGTSGGTAGNPGTPQEPDDPDADDPGGSSTSGAPGDTGGSTALGSGSSTTTGGQSDGGTGLSPSGELAATGGGSAVPYGFAALAVTASGALLLWLAARRREGASR